MSSLTAWLLLSALPLVALLAINAITYRRRHGGLMPAGTHGHSHLKQPIARSTLGVSVLFVLSLLVGVGAPYIEPEGAFSRWLMSPYAKLAYFAWCYLGFTTVAALLGAYKRYAGRGLHQRLDA